MIDVFLRNKEEEKKKIQLCLKVKFLPFYTPTGLGRVLPGGCTEWCGVYPRSSVK